MFTHHTAAAQARAWNLCWKPGTKISVMLHTGNRVDGYMLAPATVCNGEAVVEWERLDCWPIGKTHVSQLDRVKPATPEMIDAAPLRGAL